MHVESWHWGGEDKQIARAQWQVSLAYWVSFWPVRDLVLFFESWHHPRNNTHMHILRYMCPHSLPTTRAKKVLVNEARQYPIDVSATMKAFCKWEEIEETQKQAGAQGKAEEWGQPPKQRADCHFSCMCRVYSLGLSTGQREGGREEASKGEGRRAEWKLAKATNT